MFDSIPSRPSSSFRTGYRYTVHVGCDSLFTHSHHSHHFAIDTRVEPQRKVPHLIDIPSFPYMYLPTRHFCSLTKCCLPSIHPSIPSPFFSKGKGKSHSKVPRVGKVTGLLVFEDGAGWAADKGREGEWKRNEV